MALPRKIDTHHHFIPQEFAEAIKSTPGGDPSGWILPNWTPEASENVMEEAGVRSAILSVTAPGPTILEGAAAVKLARKINEHGADLRNQKPDRFGFFASVPDLWDVDAALDEIKYALDTLKADGVVLMTRYGKGNYYLGHEKFKPIWEELNKRHAVVFIHPTHPVDTTLISPMMPQPLIEYPHESTRTAVDLILSNRKRENPNCKVILSHGGGTLPFLIKRVTLAATSFPDATKTAEEIFEDAKSFHYDLALSTAHSQLKMILDFVPHDQILYGSDFPYAPRPAVLSFTQDLDSYPMEDSLRKKIYFENASKLIPRLAGDKARF
ncbi:hypothetical protein IWX49DRAFT_394543 [Phyllosticta citricarpa]|uniref:6-methylsalicylate decarboxylase n=1 Tax=Phyllosticta citricarpa TaxID=55181 RepID=A0ABR1MCN6_9PEZI